ncbi:hypothetical protein [Mesorhizobium argentiipisi]|uniref:DUF2087 domain-containing protein n=1 Tax=Mesorhizobium argentiipisi TaxID=3015175 RepID=A0ABU8KH50_9HYPH
MDTHITLTLRSLIKLAILHDEAVTIDDLQTLLNENDMFPSRFLISEVRHSFRSDLKFLRAKGLLNEIDKNSLEPLPVRPKPKPKLKTKPVRRPVTFYYDE